MVDKNKTGEKRGKVEVGKLKLKKETVKDLTYRQQKEIKGGQANTAATCECVGTVCTRRATGCNTVFLLAATTMFM